jgi:hypothetical protein
MVCFQTKKPYLGKFGRALHRLKNADIFYGHWNIFWRFGIFYDHLVHFVFIWNIFSGFGIMYIPRKICQRWTEATILLLRAKFKQNGANSTIEGYVQRQCSKNSQRRE